MPERTPEEIQREIEQARDALAVTVDELAVRANPKRLVSEAKQSALAKLRSPAGRAVIGGVGALFVIVVIRRIRKHPVEKPPLRLPAGVYQVN